MRYQRVLVKLSGGALAGSDGGSDGWGFDPKALNHIADEVLSLHQLGVEVGIVIGGGNIFRGELGQQWGIERAEADSITVINSLMLRGVLHSRGKVDVRVMTAIPINSVAEPFIRLRAIRHLERGCVVVFAAGVNGVYTGDPRTDARSARYVRVSYDTVIQRNLKAMDQSAVLLARDHALPLHVFDFDTPGEMRRLCEGTDCGTLIAFGTDVLETQETA
jgi:uridylate kinase